MIIYERWMSMRTHFTANLDTVNTALRAFLKAQTVTPTTKHPQMRLNKALFIESPPKVVRKWKSHEMAVLTNNKHIQVTPSIDPTPQQQAPVSSNNVSNGNTEAMEVERKEKEAEERVQPVTPRAEPKAPNPTMDNKQTFTLEDVAASAATGAIHAYKEHVKGGVVQTKGKSKASKDKLEDTFGMCKSEFDQLLQMCGLTAGKEDELPQLWKLLAEDGLSTA